MESPQQPQLEEPKIKKQWPTTLVALGLGLASGIGIAQADCSPEEHLEPELAKALEPGKLKGLLIESGQLVRKCLAGAEKCLTIEQAERASHDKTIAFLESINHKAGDCCLEQDWHKRMKCYYERVDIPINKHVKKVRPNLPQF